MIIKWNQILSNESNVELFKSFACGVTPKNDLLKAVAHTPISPMIRGAVRQRGTKRFKEAVVKALSRRGQL